MERIFSIRDFFCHLLPAIFCISSPCILNGTSTLTMLDEKRFLVTTITISIWLNIRIFVTDKFIWAVRQSVQTRNDGPRNTVIENRWNKQILLYESDVKNYNDVIKNN